MHLREPRKIYINEVQCVKSRLDPIRAAVLRVKLAYLDECAERRRALAAADAEALADTSITLAQVPEWAEPVWHLNVFRSPAREALQAPLAEAGGGTLIDCPVPPHEQDAKAELRLAPDLLPVARQLADEVLSLPMGPHFAPGPQSGCEKR